MYLVGVNVGSNAKYVHTQWIKPRQLLALPQVMYTKYLRQSHVNQKTVYTTGNAPNQTVRTTQAHLDDSLRTDWPNTL